jgi:tetratricopeptide (TPR) repeat protein
MSQTERAQKRLLFLEKLAREGSTDALALYGLAMEYKTAGRTEDALGAFINLRALHPDYVAMYLMCGEALSKALRTEEARAWLEEGLVVARRKGETHAVGELESALATL